MIRRVMIEVYPIRVIMKSRKSWFKTMGEVREWVMSMLVDTFWLTLRSRESSSRRFLSERRICSND